MSIFADENECPTPIHARSDVLSDAYNVVLRTRDHLPQQTSRPDFRGLVPIVADYVAACVDGDHATMQVHPRPSAIQIQDNLQCIPIDEWNGIPPVLCLAR
jgi:hypothetical protein